MTITGGSTPTVEQSQRWARYSSAPFTHRLVNTTVEIIGVGAVGGNVARLLASMGCPNIVIWDHDAVDLANLGTQGWTKTEVGMTKVTALASDLKRRNPDMGVFSHAEKFPPEGDHPLQKAIFCCVDSMAARKQIFEYVVGRGAKFFADGRTSPFSAQIRVWTDDLSPEVYLKTIFDDKEALPAPCSLRSTLHCSMIAASLLVNEYTKWLAEGQTNDGLLINLDAMEFHVPAPAPVQVPRVEIPTETVQEKAASPV